MDVYTVEHRDGLLNILWNGKPVVEGMEAAATLEGNRTVPLKLKSHSHVLSGGEGGSRSAAFSFEYGDEEEKVSLVIKFNQVENLLTCRVEAYCINSHYWNKVVTFAPLGGVKLGVRSLGQVRGLMANYLYSDYWTRPWFKKDLSELPPRTQSLLWNDGEVYHYLLPVCGDVVKCELAGNGAGFDVLVSAYDGSYTSHVTPAFILGAGENPYDLPQKAVGEGFRCLGRGWKTGRQRRYPEVFEYLGWCSWDAFYYNVSADGLLSKAREFKELALPVRWMIIDDGWSEQEGRQLLSFKEIASKFPKGLKGLTQELKGKWGIKWVGIWQAFTGYWHGIHPESRLALEMKDYLFKTNSGYIIPYPDGTKGFGFWNTWHSYLKEQGVDFVKVDNQDSISKLTAGSMSVGRAAAGAHQALEASVCLNFDGCIVNCMGMASELLWNRPATAVARNSDDFYPRKKGSLKEHALQNAYNSFYHSAFVYGDWDMWWTVHPDSTSHAVMRAVSGGPVYISDPPNQTEAEKIWPLVLSDGKLLRCDGAGMPTEDCLLTNPNEEPVALKIWNRSGKTGVVAALNINLEGKSVRGRVGPLDVPDLSGERFIVYDHFSGKAVKLDRGGSLEFSLDDGRAALYLVVPEEEKLTPIGLVDKYISPAGIESVFTGEDEVTVVLRDGGVFGFVCDGKPSVYVNGEKRDYEEGDGLFLLDIKDVKGKVSVRIQF